MRALLYSVRCRLRLIGNRTLAEQDLPKIMDETLNNKSTRERVLDTLLSYKKCTINDLAEAVEINPISVRHHINRLEAEGLVCVSGRKAWGRTPAPNLLFNGDRPGAFPYALPAPHYAPPGTAESNLAAADGRRAFLTNGSRGGRGLPGESRRNGNRAAIGFVKEAFRP